MKHKKQRRFRPSALSWIIAALLLGGTLTGVYPMTAAWFTSYNQSKVISNYEQRVDQARPAASEQLRRAHEYNNALSAGVQLGKNANVPTGTGVSANQDLDYNSILSAGADGLMARIKIPSADVDLPVYHGTSDEVLLEGAGHLEGTHLPVGGQGTRSVITAHRGLANATMFTHLDRVKVGDTFTIEVFGEVLSYRVKASIVIDPDDTAILNTEAHEDLVSLITCTPLGINTQRIVVTGERITPTPTADLAAAGDVPDIPGFPWWVVIIAAGLAASTGYLWVRGRKDPLLRSASSPALSPTSNEAKDSS